MFAIPFPVIDPMLIEIGPLAIRWYALAYVVGLILGWRYMLHLARRFPEIMSGREVDDFLLWATLGVILGGRIGYVLFYLPGGLANDPLTLIAVWRGGMSFHGGLVGVIVALIVFCLMRKLAIKRVGDILCCAVPIGLLLGRIANFINSELWGRTTDVPWAMVFPHSGGLPRHPSQLYEAFFEGALLFAILAWLVHCTRAIQRPGLLAGLFLAGYGLARFGIEFVRQPDAQLGFLYAGATMGQLLSIPMVLFGVYSIWRANRAAKA